MMQQAKTEIRYKIDFRVCDKFKTHFKWWTYRKQSSLNCFLLLILVLSWSLHLRPVNVVIYDCVKKKYWKFYYVYFPNEGCRINWWKYEFGLQYILFCFTIFKGLDLQTYAMGMTMKKLLGACYRLGQE